MLTSHFQMLKINVHGFLLLGYINVLHIPCRAIVILNLFHLWNPVKSLAEI